MYEGLLYGTLKSEVTRLWEEGKYILFDIDVKGAINIKKQFPNEAVAVFIRPPSIDALYQRLKLRNTEDEASLQKRIGKATEEMGYENQFDLVLVNDVLEKALAEAEKIITDNIKS